MTHPGQTFPAAESSRMWLTFEAAGRLLAVPAEAVREVFDAGAVARLHGCPPCVAGVANYRGRLLPMADLAALWSDRRRDVRQEDLTELSPERQSANGGPAGAQESASVRAVVLERDGEWIGVRIDRLLELERLEPVVSGTFPTGVRAEEPHHPLDEPSEEVWDAGEFRRQGADDSWPESLQSRDGGETPLEGREAGKVGRSTDGRRYRLLEPAELIEEMAAQYDGMHGDGMHGEPEGG